MLLVTIVNQMTWYFDISTHAQLDRHKNLGGMSKVSEMMEKLEKQQAETKKQLEQVMKAEIKSR